MKKLLLAFILISGVGFTKAQPVLKQNEDIIISTGTKSTDLIYKVNKFDGRLYQVYLGSKLGSVDDITQFKASGHLAYATFGTDNLFEPAIRMTHNDGNPSLELKYVSHNIEKPSEDITITSILLRDPEYPVDVTIYIKSYIQEDVIEQWTEIVQKEANPVPIYDYASSMLNFDANKYWLTQFHGDWAEEMKMQENELTSGIKILDSKLGTRAHMYQTPVFFLSLDKKSDENNGELIAGRWDGQAISGSFLKLTKKALFALFRGSIPLLLNMFCNLANYLRLLHSFLPGQITGKVRPAETFSIGRLITVSWMERNRV